ncbi:MAG: CPBP family intramembrane metalloprotease [Aigarchaeota archaeon]|nr:CPBP family intramembrane metalloprotease [Candidatus Pelearchaeum maunauluense]
MSMLGGAIWEVGAITIAPITEEVMWRGYALGRLPKVYNYHWRAIFITALSWALFHGPNIHLIAITFAAGIIAGYVYLRNHRLIQVIMAHLFINIWNWSAYLLS